MFSQLATSALYLLAAPSTPPEARDEVLTLIDGGEKISYSCVKTIVNRCKKPLLCESEAEKTVDIQIEPNLALVEPLFRLKTSELGDIVRLYHADEIEKITDFNVGATVRIKVGCRSGQTATIAEVLNEQQLDNNDRSSLNRANSTSFRKNNFAIYPLEKIDSSKSELQEPHLVIKYGDVHLAIEGDRTLLTAFTTQIQNQIDFVAEIFELALDRQRQTPA